MRSHFLNSNYLFAALVAVVVLIETSVYLRGNGARAGDLSLHSELESAHNALLQEKRLFAKQKELSSLLRELNKRDLTINYLNRKNFQSSQKLGLYKRVLEGRLEEREATKTRENTLISKTTNTADHTYNAKESDVQVQAFPPLLPPFLHKPNSPLPLRSSRCCESRRKLGTIARGEGRTRKA
jgi:hypothetical protein